MAARRPMLRFLTRRLAFMALTLLIVSMVIFGVTEMLPGDVAVMILGSEATDETLASAAHATRP